VPLAQHPADDRRFDELGTGPDNGDDLQGRPPQAAKIVAEAGDPVNL
jgi:hypothetical protein